MKVKTVYQDYINAWFIAQLAGQFQSTKTTPYNYNFHVYLF